VGAVVGAIPPLMGWASAAGSLEPAALLLAGALFSWQMPHFMALAYLNREDYARAGYRMLSMLDPLGKRTAGCALRHSLLLLPVGALAAGLHMATAPFAAEAAALAGAMAFYSARFYLAPSSASARLLFRSSLAYLPLLLAALAVHRLPNDHSLSWEVLQRALLEERQGQAALAQPGLPQRRQQQQEEQQGAQEGWVGAALGPLARMWQLWMGMLSTSREVIEVSRNMKCPSRAYGEVGEEEAAQGQEGEAQGHGGQAQHGVEQQRDQRQH
jgi:protoheme IX farnesyltransferase